MSNTTILGVSILTVTMSTHAFAAAAVIDKHGDEAILKVKKKNVSYVLPAADNTWHVKTTGPSKFVIGIRVVSETALPGRATLHAQLDDTSVSDTTLTLKPARDIRLNRVQKRAKTKYSAEVGIEIDVGAGEHTLALSLTDASGLARTLERPGKKVVALAAFTPLPTAAAEKVAPPATPEPTVAEASEGAGDVPNDTNDASVTEVAATTVAAAPPVEEIMAHEASAVDLPDSQPTEVAAEASPSTTSAKLFPLTVGVAFRTAFPQVISELGTAVGGNVSVGFLLPVLSQRLELYVDVGFSQSSRQTSATDPRLLSSQQFDLTLVEQELMIGMGGIYRLWSPDTPLNFFGRIGVQMNLQRSNVKGDAATEAFGENDETDTAVGVALGGGASYRVGPGAIEAELSFSFAGLDHHVSGDSSTGGLGIGLGYRLMF